MHSNRILIDHIADITRTALGLNSPIELQGLCDAIKKNLPGYCVSVSGDELSVDAAIKTSDNDNNENVSFIIRYRNDRPKARVLFSIAHELGHLFLDLLKNDGGLKASVELQRDMSHSQNELRANEYAGAFLMPENEFIVKCKEYTYDNKVNITLLSKHFNVSEQAVTVRGNVLGLW